ncbi:bi-domain-containing oxidoreductase [Tianweitania sediminis]|uniref:Bi-domain-containing oxidoreductase n=2 Tax=Tianweitania sediminis TaxID=1502156 RepID=A0A8J7UI64_9HYPH|nr:bi-domain-containing oxidoreductase [Tianweitania sediminis]
MLVSFGKAGLIGKARAQPERLRDVIAKARTDGVLSTLDAVRAKLDRPLALGYCNVGTVVDAGPGTSEWRVGDRIASNGSHAEIISVPATLCARVPDAVSDDQAAFTVITAIALQGLRLAQPTFGECVAVIGLGLVGLLTVQLLHAQGCRVLGLDFDPARVALAAQFGAETVTLGSQAPLPVAQAFSRARGIDAVVIAAATRSSDPVRLAATMSRKRGRIVLVGVSGLQLDRADFYEKELSFQVSCSYGPGRHDPAYEEAGQDYPAPFVRWTAQRNFEAALDTMAAGQLQLEPLISHRFAIDQAEAAYELVDSAAPSLGILLSYPERQQEPKPLAPQVVPFRPPSPGRNPAVGVIGAGDYAMRTLLPAFKRADASFHEVVARNGLAALHAQRRFGFHHAGTSVEALLHNAAVEAVVIATRHSSHAALVAAALNAGKHVFVEKPLAVDREGLASVQEAWTASRGLSQPPLLTVGFNRRFAPHVAAVKQTLVRRSGPATLIMTVNAGIVPASHWTQQDEEGGRITGEACHFVDLLRHLAGAPITQASACGRGDVATLQLAFTNGCTGTVHYLANGASTFPKERLEVFCDGTITVIDNFRRIRSFGRPAVRPMPLWRQNKGQDGCAAAFLQAIRNNGPEPIPAEELFEVARVTLDLAETLRR